MGTGIKAVAILLATFAVSLALVTYMENTYERVCVNMDEVISVGGCDRNGYCGAMTKRNGKRSLHSPVVGEHVCLKTERRRR